jgi:hypothetical protein
MLRPITPIKGAPKGSRNKSVSINFTGLTDLTPNTTLFQATLKFLQGSRKMNAEAVTEFHEAVFEAYFMLGVFPYQDGFLEAAKTFEDPKVYESIAQLYQNLATKLANLHTKVIYGAIKESH